MVQFTQCDSCNLFYSVVEVYEVHSYGLPHSEIPASQNVCFSTGLIAAYYVFIALQLLGIRHKPIIRLTILLFLQTILSLAYGRCSWRFVLLKEVLFALEVSWRSDNYADSFDRPEALSYWESCLRKRPDRNDARHAARCCRLSQSLRHHSHNAASTWTTYPYCASNCVQMRMFSGELSTWCLCCGSSRWEPWCRSWDMASQSQKPYQALLESVAGSKVDVFLYILVGGVVLTVGLCLGVVM